MTDTTATTYPGPKLPLGVGAILSESFRILFRNIVPIIVLSAIPLGISTVLGMVNNYLTFGSINPVLLEGEMPVMNAAQGTSIAFSGLIQLAITLLLTCLLTQLAYDAKLGRTIQIRTYFTPALRVLLPLMVLSVGIYILLTLSAALFIIPGLIVLAMFSVIAPVSVVEGLGLGAAGRSRRLTKEYRWPIIGLILLTFIAMLLMSLPIGAIVGVVAYLTQSFGTGSYILLTITNLLLSAIMMGLVCIVVALIYARLREIKEGISVDSLAAVFD